MSAKPSESHDEIKKVSSNGPVLEQAKLNPLSKNSEGIRTSRVLMQGVEQEKEALKPMIIIGVEVRLVEEKLVALLAMV
uniref:Uncharacterized protein n=1 Tax=Cucumis melo TaxID=3656 RepID=A0A9I9CG70_CUCME